MAANIDGIACKFLKGGSDDPKLSVQTWIVPGMAGIGAHTSGLNSGRFQFTAVLYDTLPLVRSWMSDLEELQGTVVDAEDDQGTLYEDLMVVSVRRRTPTVAYIPPDPTYRGEVVIEGAPA